MTEDPVLLPYRREMPRPFDPAGEFFRLRAEEPVCRQQAPNGDWVWLVTRYPDVCQVLSDRGFSNARTPQTLLRPRATGIAAVGAPARQPGSFLGYDPPGHTRLRKMVSSVFTARRTALLRPRITEIVGQLLDLMDQAGPPSDLHHAFSLQLPSRLICDLLGVPYEDRENFQHSIERAFDLTLEKTELASVFGGIWSYLAELVARKRKHPDDAVIGTLVREHGDDLSDTELTGISNLLLIAGHDTTANMITLGTLLLLQHPEQLAVVRDSPAAVDGAVEELLRYLSVVQTGLVRTATQDTVVGGQPVRAGEYVMLSMASANRDEMHFADPDQFDITKVPQQHVAFGHGIHHCLGASLARTELTIAFPALFRRFPGLRLAVPLEEIRFRGLASVYGAESVQVTW
jgi:cytochrome P450